MAQSRTPLQSPGKSRRLGLARLVPLITREPERSAASHKRNHLVVQLIPHIKFVYQVRSYVKMNIRRTVFNL